MIRDRAVRRQQLGHDVHERHFDPFCRLLRSKYNAPVQRDSDEAFSWQVRVYYEDVDIGGVVYYANYLRYFERARSEWLRSLGVNQERLAAVEGIGFVVARAEVDFKAGARLDDLLSVTVKMVEKKKPISGWSSRCCARTGGI